MFAAYDWWLYRTMIINSGESSAEALSDYKGGRWEVGGLS